MTGGQNGTPGGVFGLSVPAVKRCIRGSGIRFLAPQTVRGLSGIGCPRSERLALGVSQGAMGLLLAGAVGRARPWSRQLVNNWEHGAKPLTALAREAYRRLLIDVLFSAGLFLRRRRGRRMEAVRPCRRCRRWFAVAHIRERNCHRCRRD